MTEAPVVREDDASGLLVIDWPKHRDAELVISCELFEAMVVMINIERRRAQSLAIEAGALCDAWDRNDITGGEHVAALRSIIEGES